MKTSNKLFLIFPYHDPKGEYNQIFKNQLTLLKNIFNGICISATPETIANNADFLSFLQNEGCFIYENEKDTTVGDHFRNALKIGLEKSSKQSSYFYFGFIDRILFDLKTKFKKSFIKDIKAKYKEDLIIFSRSKKTWASHPANYYNLEKIIADTDKVFTGKVLDWIWCGALIEKNLAELILKKSKINNFAILAEFNVIAYKNNKIIKNKNVDWAAWENTFWAKYNKQVKYSWDLSEKEKQFRLRYCLDAMKLFLK